MCYTFIRCNRIILTHKMTILGSQTETQVSNICIYKFINDKFTNERILQIHDLEQGVIQFKKV